MKYEIIGSSSKGNCIIVEDILMLDCGVSYKKIKDKLNKVKLIFISHAHSDHLNMACIKQLIYSYPTIKFVTGSKDVVEKLIKCGARKKNIYLLKEGIRYDLGMLKVRLVYLYHDVDNYGIKWQLNGKKGIYCVDTSRLDHIVAEDYDLYLIEANYKEEILQQHIDKVSRETIGDLKYLLRVPETHLSWENCNDFLLNNMGENSRFEYLHQSEYNFEKENKDE